MAEHVAIPAGVNPAAAVPADASTYGSANRGSAAPGSPGGDGGIPAVPPAAAQQPGHAPAAQPTVDAAAAAEFAAFQKWKADQAAAANPATPATPAQPAAFQPVAAGEGMGADAAMAAVKAAGDPVVANTFEMFATVAPAIDLGRAVGNAIDRADLSLIDRAYLREAGGDKADKLIALAEGMVKHVNTQVEQLVGGIFTAAGGEAQWNAAAAAFSANAPVYLKQYAVDALNSANPQRIREATRAILDFTKQSGALPVAPQGHVRAGGGTPDASLGMSKQEYQEARLKLNRFDRNYNDQARELDARRAIGKKMGR